MNLLIILPFVYGQEEEIQFFYLTGLDATKLGQVCLDDWLP